MAKYYTIIDPEPPVKSYLGACPASGWNQRGKGSPEGLPLSMFAWIYVPTLFLSVLLRYLDPDHGAEQIDACLLVVLMLQLFRQRLFGPLLINPRL